MKPDMSLTDMISTIRSLIHVEDTPLVLKYLDDEDEWVTIDRDIEFECALTITGNPIRLAVSLAEETRQCRGFRGGRRGGKCRGKGMGRGKFGKHCRRNQPEEPEDADSAVTDSETTSDTKECKKRFKKEFKKECKRGGRGRGKQWKNKQFRCDENDNESESASSVDPNLTPEEIETKIDALKQHKHTVFEQLKEARTKFWERKQAIKQCRRAPERAQEIPALRLSIIEAKTAMFAVRCDLRSTKCEIRQLKQALRAKKDSHSE